MITVSFTIIFKHSKFHVDLPASFTIHQLKQELVDLTKVPVSRQKLLNLIKGKLPADNVQLKDLNLNPNLTVTLLGTPDDEMFVESFNDEIVDDFIQVDLLIDDERFVKLAKKIEQTSIVLMNPLRPGKKLAVFDLDYTLFDCKSIASNITELIRPGMHEMFKAIYPYYDLVIWSQTSWKWLEMKITEMGMLNNPNYSISFVLDRTSMFQVESKKCHQVKALEIIWRKFDQFSAKNTIHVDDLSRNFVMNPQSGLKIGAFKQGPINRFTDVELLPLTRYLLQLVLVDDFTTLNHKQYKEFNGPIP